MMKEICKKKNFNKSQNFFFFNIKTPIATKTTTKLSIIK